MIVATKIYVNVDPNSELDYYDAGRCYRRTAIPNNPIITRVSWDLLNRDINPSSYSCLEHKSNMEEDRRDTYQHWAL